MSNGISHSNNWSKDSGKFVMGGLGLTLLIFLNLRMEALAHPQTDSVSPSWQKGRGNCLPWLNNRSLVPSEGYNHGQIHAATAHITDVLLTNQIDESHFPYSSQQRSPVSLNPQALFNLLSKLPEVDDLSITSILIGSPEKDAQMGIVRLGFLQNGRPVIVKTLIRSVAETERMNEARGAMLLSAIGVGPLFHGIARDGGSFHLITDLIIGKSFNTFAAPTIQGLRQLHTIVARFNRIHLDHLPDHELLFQVMRTNSDQILAIDAEGYYEVFLEGNPELKDQAREEFSDDDFEPPWERRLQSPHAPKSSWVTPWYRLLASAIITADRETAQQFMAELREYNRPLYKLVSLEINAIITKWNPIMDKHLKDYFLNLDEPK
ncbi:MAG: hypothetical protein IPL83_03645 [Bdellovibrionales bacterium]|nr:hypothetical protein [Bdellovibrionales bacterium]